jgi:hypothetical protein
MREWSSGERTLVACWRARPRNRELFLKDYFILQGHKERSFRQNAETRSPRRPLPQSRKLLWRA